MLVGIMSDSHDNVPNIRKALDVLERRGVEAIVHAGDFVAPFAVKALAQFNGTIIAVFGNNDGEKDGIRKVLPSVAEPPLRVQIGGVRFVITHDLARLTDRGQCDVIVHGHTHDAEIIAGEPLIINPGETGGWLRGKESVALLDTDAMRCEIIDLEKNR